MHRFTDLTSALSLHSDTLFSQMDVFFSIWCFTRKLWLFVVLVWKFGMQLLCFTARLSLTTRHWQAEKTEGLANVMQTKRVQFVLCEERSTISVTEMGYYGRFISKGLWALQLCIVQHPPSPSCGELHPAFGISRALWELKLKLKFCFPS